MTTTWYNPKPVTGSSTDMVVGEKLCIDASVGEEEQGLEGPECEAVLHRVSDGHSGVSSELMV